MLAVLLINMILATLTLGFAAGNTPTRQVPTNTPPPTAPTTTSEPPCQPIEEALRLGRVRLTLIANNDLFFRKPLDYRIENLTSETYTLCFAAGLIAYPVDPQYQRMMLTSGYFFTMMPGSVEEGAFYANCINEDLHPPEAGVEYRLETMADGDLLGVANAIDDREAQGRLGSQMATWAVTDAFTLDDLAGAGGSGLTSAIRPLLCLTTGEVELAQLLLEDAGTDLRIYTSENPADYCQSQGIPSLEQVREVGGAALRWILIGLAACVVVGGGGLYLVIRLLRARK